MMAWIKVEQSLRHHRKLRRLANELGITEVTAAGHLLFLWLWALDNAPDGNLTRISNDELAYGACTNGDPETFVEAMVKAGLMDRKGRGARGLHIHDWDQYGGQLRRSRDRHREVVRRSRDALDKIRVDQIRSEESRSEPPPKSPSSKAVVVDDDTEIRMP